MILFGEAGRQGSDALHKRHDWQTKQLSDAFALDGTAYRRSDELQMMNMIVPMETTAPMKTIYVEPLQYSSDRGVQTRNLSDWSTR